MTLDTPPAADVSALPPAGPPPVGSPPGAQRGELKAALDDFRSDFARLRGGGRPGDRGARADRGRHPHRPDRRRARPARRRAGARQDVAVNTLASALSVTFGRVQFTPDLMPADLVGTNVVTEDETGRKRFEFQKGPIFAHVLLADEVNRATPENAVRVARSDAGAVRDRRRDHPQTAGALPRARHAEPAGNGGHLPAARGSVGPVLFVKLLVEFPTAADLGEILNRTTAVDHAHGPAGAGRGAGVGDAGAGPAGADRRRRCGTGRWRWTLATHPQHPSAPEAVKKYVRFGSSPRGAQAMVLAAKVRAILDGRFHVAKDDLHDAAPAVLRHRLILGVRGAGGGGCGRTT